MQQGVPASSSPATIVPVSQYEAVKSELEDAQESLAAALARIEVLRQQNKRLAQEIAALRLGGRTSDASAAVAAEPDGNVSSQAAAPAQGAVQQPAAESPTPTTQQQHEQQQQQRRQQEEVEQQPQHVPVTFIHPGGRKAQGSVVVTPQYVEFLEVRAHIRRATFTGIAPAPPLQQCLPCLSSPPSSPRAGAGDASGSPAPAAAGSGSAAAPSGEGAWSLAALAASLLPSAVVVPRLSPSSSFSNRQQLQQQLQQVQLPTLDAPQPLLAAAFSSPAGSGASSGAWQVLWQAGGQQQQLVYEASREAHELLQRHTARWLGGDSGDDGGGGGGTSSVQQASSSRGSVDLAAPRHLTAGSFSPRLSEPSVILRSASGGGASSSGALVDGLPHLAAVLPGRFQRRDWCLAYSMSRHGISLGTLYRRAAGSGPSVLLIRDDSGFVFGAFCTEPWHPAPRFFGTGETLVFQLAPHRVAWGWRVRSPVKNDFFQLAQPNALAVGGLGAFAIWLDEELLQGSSGSCGTFGSPSLSGSEEFTVAALELWSLQ